MTNPNPSASEPLPRGTGVDRPVAPPEAPAAEATRAEAEELTEFHEQGLEIKSRSQWQLARRRFFRHKLAVGSLVVLLLIVLAGIFAEQLAPYSFREQNPLEARLAPTLEGQHYFGTDVLGRDYFSRTLFGIRTSLYVAGIVALVSAAIGALYGAISGYFGGWADNLMMRFVDLILTLPILAVLIVIAALWGEGSPTRVAIILALFYWTTLARIIRGNFLSLREKEYVEAARASGASDTRIIFRHMLPNSLGPIVVNATLIVATAILVEATLSFLGFGVQPPQPALGKLIDDARGFMTSMPWLVLFPGATIVLIVLCINFVGDGLRDALDPTQRRNRA
jgi:ABC-type dipeptide/oligopeptide/nickel transport system permease subunit